MSRRARSSLAVDGARAAGGQGTDTGRGGESDARHVARRAAPARAGSIIGSLKSLLGIKNKAEVRKGNVDAALPILHVLFCAFVVAGRTRDRQRTQGIACSLHIADQRRFDGIAEEAQARCAAARRGRAESAA